MFDELCRRIYWAIWRRMPSEEEALSRMSPEEREMLEEFKKMMGVKTYG